MPRTSRHADVIARRRAFVARMRLRGLSVREIAAELAKITDDLGRPLFVNPRSGKPLNHAQVVRDLKAVREEWRKDAMEPTGEHRARQMAELREVKRAAIADEDTQAWLRAIKLEMDLLGTVAPTRGLNVDLSALSDEQIDRLARGEDLFDVLASQSRG